MGAELKAEHIWECGSAKSLITDFLLPILVVDIFCHAIVSLVILLLHCLHTFERAEG